MIFYKIRSSSRNRVLLVELFLETIRKIIRLSCFLCLLLSWLPVLSLTCGPQSILHESHLTPFRYQSGPRKAWKHFLWCGLQIKVFMEQNYWEQQLPFSQHAGVPQGYWFASWRWKRLLQVSAIFCRRLWSYSSFYLWWWNMLRVGC